MAINDLELLEDTADGLRTIKIRNNSKDTAIRAQVLVSEACQEGAYEVILMPLAVARVAHGGLTPHVAAMTSLRPCT